MGQPPRTRFHFSVGLSERDAGFEPRGHPHLPHAAIFQQPPALAVQQGRHAHGDPDLHAHAGHGAAELLRRDSGHGQFVTIHADGPADGARIALEQALPEPVADHGHRRCARIIGIFRGQERASAYGLDAQHRKVVAGDVFAVNPARAVGRANVEPVEERGGEAGKGLESVAIIAVITVGSVEIFAGRGYGFERRQMSAPSNAGERAYQETCRSNRRRSRSRLCRAPV